LLPIILGSVTSAKRLLDAVIHNAARHMQSFRKLVFIS
jgi:hypothetical protein